MTRERQILTFLEGQIIGTLYLSSTGSAYLNYCYKTSSNIIDMEEEETAKSVQSIAKQVIQYCKENTYDLEMY